MQKQKLTKKQDRVFSIIRRYLENKGMPPTVKEIAAEIGARSLRSVTQYLEILERKGMITRKKNVPRGIELAKFDQKGLVRIPVMASVGCDHVTVIANQDFDRFIYADPKALPKNKTIYAFQAIGSSMRDARINNGDYVLAEKTDDAVDGDRVVALLGDQAVVKKLGHLNNARVLLPENRAGDYRPIVIAEDFKLFGKVWNVIPGFESEPEEIHYEPLNEE